MNNPASDYLSSGPRFGEGDVIERIESFRRRRPRLLDDHVTLAHGAGGKASAALVDAVFVEAFRNPLLESLGDGAVLALPGGERLAMSTDSFVVQPRRFPGGSSVPSPSTAPVTTWRWPAPCRPGSPRPSCSKRASGSPS